MNKIATEKKTDRPKVGDQVFVVNPLLFVRCGYPCTMESESELVRKDLGHQIYDFLKDLGLESRDWCSRETKVYKEIVRALAYARLQKKGFGGKGRAIYANEDLEYKGVTGEVIGRCIVKTGIYQPGSYYYGDGDGEYDPPGLINEKAHRILQITSRDVPCFMIEDIHVKKL